MAVSKRPKTLVLIGVLLLLQAVLAQIKTVERKYITSSSTSTAKLYGKYVQNDEATVGTIQEYPNKTPLFCYGPLLKDSTNDNMVKCFSLTESTSNPFQFKYSTGNDAVYAIQLVTLGNKDQDGLIISDDKGKVRRLTISYNTGTSAWSSSGSLKNNAKLIMTGGGNPPKIYLQAMVQRQNSEYTYGIPTTNSDTQKMVRIVTRAVPSAFAEWDIGLSNDEISDFNTSPVYFLYFHGSHDKNLIVFGQIDKIVVFNVEVAAMPRLYTRNSPIYESRGRITLYDRADPTILIGSETDRRVYRMELKDYNTRVNVLARGTLISTQQIAGMTNVPGLKAFVAYFLYSSKMEFVQKYDMISVQISIPSDNVMPDNTMVGSPLSTSVIDFKFKVAMIFKKIGDLSNGGVQTYVVTLDNCKTRGGDKKCTECPLNYFIADADKDTANNQCLRPVDLGFGVGPDKLNNDELVPCSENCFKCSADSRICEQCTYPDTYKLVKFTDTLTKCLATVPNGYGADTATSAPIIYKKCTADCADCSVDNLKVCQSCNGDFNRVYVSDTEIKCQDTIVAADNLGLDTTQTESPLYRPCKTESYCLTCAASNYEVCMTCAADGENTVRLKKSDTDIQCTTPAIAEALGGYGRNYDVSDSASGDNYYTACKDPNCLKCFDDYSICTQCIAGMNPIQLKGESTEVTCKDFEDRPLAGYGQDQSILPDVVYRPCSQADCVSCWEDMYTCKECRCSTFLKLALEGESINPKCVPAVESLNNYGLSPDVDGFKDAYRKCANGCLNCLNDIAVCTACDPAYTYRVKFSDQDIRCFSSGVPEGYLGGPNSDEKSPSDDENSVTYYTPCADSKCGDCHENYKVCITCGENDPNYVRVRFDNSQDDISCMPKPAEGVSLDGYGLNKDTQVYQQCAKDTCVSCWEDVLSCKECECNQFLVGRISGSDSRRRLLVGETDPPGRVDLTPYTFMCEKPLEADASFGLVIPDQEDFVEVYLPCEDGCTECLENRNKCTRCMDGYLHLLDDGSVRCLNTVQKGWGRVFIDTYDSEYYERCDTRHCAECYSNNQVCEACDKAGEFIPEEPVCSRGEICPELMQVAAHMQGNTDYFLTFYGYGNLQCKERSDIEGYGFDTVNNFYVPCEAGCADCFDNYKKCVACKADNSYDTLRRRRVARVAKEVGHAQDYECGEMGDQLCTGCGFYYEAVCTWCGVYDDEPCGETGGETGQPGGPKKYYLWTSDDGNTARCAFAEEATPGYGIDEANAEIKKCADESKPGCTSCYANYQVCPDCLDGEVLAYSPSGTSDCVPLAFVAHGYRQRTGEDVYDACRTNCDTCEENGSCLTCLGEEGQNVKVILNSVADGEGDIISCLPMDQVPIGFAQNSEGIYIMCNTDCLTCLEDSSSCETCAEGLSLWHKTDTLISCEAEQYISDNYGLRKADGHYVPCANTLCAECHADYQVCTECKFNYLLWFDGSTSPKCATFENIPASFGPDEFNHYIACPDSQCISCKADLNKCIDCQDGFELWEHSSTSTTCDQLETIPVAFGRVDGLYRACPEGCLSCKDNWYICKQCSAGLSLWSKREGEVVCEQEPLIPDSYGLSLNSIYVPCSPHCADCKANLKKCRACDENYSLWEKSAESTVCELPNLIDNGFGKNDVGTFVRCSVNCLQCKENNNLCTLCSGTNRIWEKSDDEHVCAVEANIFGAYGKKNADLEVSAYSKCQDGCNACKANINICTECRAGLSLWMQSTESTVCETESLIPESFGRNANGIFTTCQDPNCVSCKDDRQKCSRCRADWSLWLKINGDVVCAKKENIVGAYGLNGAGSFVSCGSNCLACLDNVDQCTLCADTYSRWQKTDSLTVCEKKDAIDAGFGLSTALNLFIKCNPECAECKENQAQCTKCNDPWVMWMKDGTSGVCASKCEIDDGYGRNDQDVYVRCADSHCLQCLDAAKICTNCQTNYDLFKESNAVTSCKIKDKTTPVPPEPTKCSTGCLQCSSAAVCTQCDGPTYKMWAKSTEDVICVTKDQITDGFGLNELDKVVPCLAHCLKCKESIYICQKCDKANGYEKWFKTEVSTVCELPINIPASNGLSQIADQYEACFDGCLECPRLKTVCTRCDSSRGLRRILKSDTDVPCDVYANIPIGFGIREANNSEVIQCPSEICSGKICPSNGICNPDDNPGNKRVKSTSYNFRTVTATITFFNDSDRSVFVPDSVMFIGYVKGSIHPDLTDIDYTWSLSDNSGVDYKLDTKGKDYQLTNLVVKSRAKQAGASSAMHSQLTQAQQEELQIQFDDIEFQFGEVYLIPDLESTGSKKSGTSTFANVLQYILKLIGFAFKVLLIPLDFFLAFTVDWVVATFSYLKLLSSPHVIKPSNVIHYLSSRTLFGFTISNPYKSWADAPECQVPMTIGLHSLQCSLFYNYGHNLNILLAALVLAITVYIITSLALWLINDPNDEVNKWTRVVRYFFGFRYFFLFMHGVFLDLFGLILLNMTADDFSDSAVGAGLGLGIGILVFYAVFYVIVTYAIKVKIDLLKAGQPVAARPVLSYFNFLSDPFRFDGRHPWLLYMALFWPVKSTIVIIIAIAARYKGLGQTVPIFVVEVLGLLILIATRAKKRMMDNAFDVVFQLLLCIYIGTEMVLSGKDDRSFVQDSGVSVFMTVILYIMAIIAIIYVILRALRAFARLNTTQSIPNVLLPPVYEVEEASLLLDQSAAWTVHWN